jgi:error-prone DNA polymerase
MDEQPMGFYAPDALVHDAQRHGIEVLAPDVNLSQVGCTVTDQRAVRVGLGYVLGVRADEVVALVAARDVGGPFADIDDLAARAGAGRPALEQLAWSGACDSLTAGDRRAALWAVGAASAALPSRVEGVGTQLALPLGHAPVPGLPALQRWEAMIADYATTGLTVHTHPMILLRPALDEEGAVTSGALETLPHRRRVRVGGLVLARQRPATANGVTFLLLEDEQGTVNVIVPQKIYERDRLAVRTEPLLVVEGILERHASAGGAVNVLARQVSALEAPDAPLADVHEVPRPHNDFGALEEAAGRKLEDEREDAADFRAVAPATMSFAQGRRR